MRRLLSHVHVSVDSRNAPFLVVANKTDLCADEPDSSATTAGPADSDEVLPLDDSAQPSRTSSSDSRPRRATSRAEAQALAEAEGLLYVETSAKDGSGVEAAFARTAREVLGRMRARGEAGTGGKKVRGPTHAPQHDANAGVAATEGHRADWQRQEDDRRMLLRRRTEKGQATVVSLA